MKIERKINIHKSPGNRNKDEKRVGNQYLNCKYKRNCGA